MPQFYKMAVQQAITLEELGEFKSAGDAVAVSLALGDDVTVVSREDAEAIAEGKATFHTLPAELKIELALRCAQEIGNRDLAEMWERALIVVTPHKKLTLDKARRRMR